MEEYVMLGTDAKHRPQPIHVIKHVETKDFSFAFVLLEHARQHG